MRVSVEFGFSASHRVSAEGAPCRGLHGHDYRVRLTLDRPLDPTTGLAADHAQIRSLFLTKVFARIDHRNLNDFLENPTAERVAIWLFDLLREDLPALSEIRVAETADREVTYAREPLS